MKRILAMKKTVVLLGLLLVFMSCCASGLSAEDGIEISVTPGKNWESTMWLFVIPIKKTPQFAAWIETVDGRFIKTLIVTGKSAKGNWIGASEQGRPEALPVWRHAAGSIAVDASSSATPTGESNVTNSASGLEKGTEYIVRFEINQSFDYNDSWPKNAKPGDADYSGVNGQPSLVYEGRFVSGRKDSVLLIPVGQGSIDGTGSEMTPGISGLTTALSIVEHILLTVKGE